MTSATRLSPPAPLDWRALVDEVLLSVRGDGFWEERLAAVASAAISLHLAIFVEPFLGYLLAGQKTVESRFATRRCPPYGRVRYGDLVLVKQSGGAILGLCEVAETWFYHLDPASWRTIREDFAHALCAQDPTFWEARQAASFATLMRVSAVRSLPPIRCPKRDRRGWVVLKPRDGANAGSG